LRQPDLDSITPEATHFEVCIAKRKREERDLEDRKIGLGITGNEFFVLKTDLIIRRGFCFQL